jgi:uracil-DNA glycosylase
MAWFESRPVGEMSQAARRLARRLVAHAEWQSLCGAEFAPAGAAVERAAGPRDASLETPAEALVAAPAKRAPGTPRGAAAGAVAPEPSDALGLDGVSDLPELRGAIGDCRRCKLHRGRTQVVFGVGNPRARLLFVGEGPGRDEDLQGEPFVGRAGQLLTDIIEKGMKLERSDVYICNVVKCRPPENRNPETDEVEACSPFLIRQIELVSPEVIVALGKFAAQTLLQTTTPITKLRGEWREYRGVPLMPTLHPAYLLRNPADKRLVWEDVKKVMARLGLTS